MSQKQDGPYRHFERPTEPRSVKNKSGLSLWLAVIIFLIVILIVLVPVVHHFAVKEYNSNQAVEVQKSSKVKISRKNDKKTIDKTKKGVNSKVKTTTKNLNKPKKPVSSENKNDYVVQEGDTLTGIAADHKMTVSELAQLNNLDTSSQINTGQVLKLK